MLKGYGVFDPNLAFPIISMLVVIAVYIPVGYFSFRIFYDKARRKGALANC